MCMICYINSDPPKGNGELYHSTSQPGNANQFVDYLIFGFRWTNKNKAEMAQPQQLSETT